MSPIALQSPNVIAGMMPSRSNAPIASGRLADRIEILEGLSADAVLVGAEQNELITNGVVILLRRCVLLIERQVYAFTVVVAKVGDHCEHRVVLDRGVFYDGGPRHVPRHVVNLGHENRLYMRDELASAAALVHRVATRVH
jgi:hypothetical protein